MAKKTIYVVHTDDGTLEIRKKLSNAKLIARRILKDFGFTHELKDNLVMLASADEGDFTNGNYLQFEIDSGKEGEPGNLYIMRKEI